MTQVALDDREELARRLATCEAELRQAREQLAHTAKAGQLQQNRDLLQTLFNGLDDGLLLLDGTGIIQIVNNALAQMFAFGPQAVVGQHWLALKAYPGFDVPGMVVLQTLYDGRPRQREGSIQSHGRRVVINIQTQTRYGLGGQIEHVILRVVDVTERLHFETLEIQHQRMAATSQLIATIAHELNTPLLSIQSCLFLAEQAADASRSAYLTLAREEIDRISTILRQLLDLHRPDTSEQVHVDLSALIDRVLLLTGGALADHHISIEREFSAEHLIVPGYPGQLTQVLLNLILNAIDAMPDGGRMTLRTRRAHDWPTDLAMPDPPVQAIQPLVVIEVADTGVGISSEIQEEIFKPFFTTRTMGTGLGLAVSRQIMQRHAGAIGVRSQIGLGSVFILALPGMADEE
jgi:PAS domain S-box-containing protein